MPNPWYVHIFIKKEELKQWYTDRWREGKRKRGSEGCKREDEEGQNRRTQWREKGKMHETTKTHGEKNGWRVKGRKKEGQRNTEKNKKKNWRIDTRTGERKEKNKRGKDTRKRKEGNRSGMKKKTRNDTWKKGLLREMIKGRKKERITTINETRKDNGEEGNDVRKKKHKGGRIEQRNDMRKEKRWTKRLDR